MRGSDEVAGSLFSYVSLEKRVRADHPLRVIRAVVNATLAGMSVEFDALYPAFGRGSIPPERLLRASLLQAFYSIRSERQLVERIDFDLLFRWFVGLGIDDPVWDATTFTKNRDRLLAGEIAGKFLATVLAQKPVKAPLSSEHFSVDGTLLEAWASPKSFRRRIIGPASHSNTTHAPTANSNSYPQQPPTGNSPSGRKTSCSTVIFSSLPENAAAAPAANAIGRDGPPLAASSISLAPCQADSAEWHVLRDVTDVAASHRVIVDPPGFDDPPRD